VIADCTARGSMIG